MARISRDELVEIIRATEEAGRDASALRAALAGMSGSSHSQQTGSRHGGEEEEVTTAEHLQRKVGDLFSGGVSDDVLAQLIKIDEQYTLKDLRKMCSEAGLGVGGDKKTLAAKLLASGNLKQGEEQMEKKGQIDLGQQKEWWGDPETLDIPKEYIKGLRYEVIVFARKERGGADFSFRCREYQRRPDGQWEFKGVIIDTSKKNPEGEVIMARLTYHPWVELAEIGFMVVPAPED